MSTLRDIQGLMVRSRVVIFALACGLSAGCDLSPAAPPVAQTGVSQTRAHIAVQASGLTIEQENIRRRLETDNLPGSVKHLYVISAFSGDVILYSTVRGKVTSSGKRLTPYTVAAGYTSDGTEGYGIEVQANGGNRRTPEVLQDDGTYGASIEYLYWWDSKGVYHQHYVSGGQIVHISSAPLRVGKVIINLEQSVETGQSGPVHIGSGPPLKPGEHEMSIQPGR